MNKSIEETLRCKLFEDISKDIWYRIIRKHSLGIDDKEIAITNDIIADILEYHQTTLLNFDVFARDGYLEKKYGSDIDIFIEVTTNRYRWFAFQAKLLKKENVYTGLNHMSSKKNPGKQWLKLRRLERLSKGSCKANYLFYNGKADFSIAKNSNCSPLVSFNEEQYGCSIIDIETIKRVATTKKPGKKRKWIIPNPSFEDFHPRRARPWRELVCCWLENDPTEITLYKLEDIIESAKNYDKLVRKGEANNDDITSEYSEKDNLKPKGDDPENIENPIIRVSSKAKWKPGLKILISTTKLNS